MVKATRFGAATKQCDFDFAVSEIRDSEVIALLSAVKDEATVVWLSDGICENSRCRAAIEATWLYRDEGHLSIEGSQFIARKLAFDRLMGSH